MVKDAIRKYLFANGWEMCKHFSDQNVWHKDDKQINLIEGYVILYDEQQSFLGKYDELKVLQAKDKLVDHFVKH